MPWASKQHYSTDYIDWIYSNWIRNLHWMVYRFCCLCGHLSCDFTRILFSVSSVTYRMNYIVSTATYRTILYYVCPATYRLILYIDFRHLPNDLILCLSGHLPNNLILCLPGHLSNDRIIYFLSDLSKLFWCTGVWILNWMDWHLLIWQPTAS